MFNYDRMNILIKKSGKTKLFLCGQLGKGKTYLRDAEKQNTNISGETLAILAKELNTSPEYLTGKTDDPDIKKAPAAQPGDELSAEFREKYSKLPPEQQKLIEAMIDSLLSGKS